MEVLESAKAKISESTYDNWNGGTYYYTLSLEIPVRLFAQIEPKLTQTEQTIRLKIGSVVRETGNQVLTNVVITPALQQAPVSAATQVPGVEVEHLWEAGVVRVFLSHVSAHKASISQLKQELSKFGISPFVAHEDIEPSREWQCEIELALRSMHVLVALLTPEFHQSNWTDQEVGFALCRGVPIVSVRLGLDPYGFIGKQQALSGRLETPGLLASAIVDALLCQPATAAIMRDSLVLALEKSASFAVSKLIAPKLESIARFTPEQLTRMEAACRANVDVRDAFGVPAKIRGIISRLRPRPREDDIPF